MVDPSILGATFSPWLPITMTQHHAVLRFPHCDLASIWARASRPSGLQGGVGRYRDTPDMGGGGVSKMLHPIFITKKKTNIVAEKWMVGRWNVTFLIVTFLGGHVSFWRGRKNPSGFWLMCFLFSMFWVLNFYGISNVFPFQAGSKMFFAILFPSAATSFLNLSSFDVLVHRYVMFHSVLVLLCHLQPLWLWLQKTDSSESWGTNLGACQACHAYPSGPSMVDMD